MNESVSTRINRASSDDARKLLTVQSDLRDGGFSLVSQHRIKFAYAGSQLSDEQRNGLQVILTLDGKNIKKQTQTKKGTTGEFNLSFAEDGHYSITIATKFATPAVGLDDSWSAKVEFDGSLPVLLVNAERWIDSSTSKRYALIDLNAKDQTDINCDATEISSSDGWKDKVVFEQGPQSSSNDLKQFKFTAKHLIPDNAKEPFFVTSSCEDKAGNMAKRFDLVNAAAVSYKLQSAMLHNQGNISGDPTRRFFSSGILKFTNDLVEQSSGKNIPASLQEIESSLLKLVVTTDAPFTSAANTKQSILFTGKFETSLVMSVPPALDGPQRIFVNLLRRSLSGSEELINAIEYPIYIDRIIEEVSFDSSARWRQVNQGEYIQSSFLLHADSFGIATMDGKPQLEYTLNNKTAGTPIDFNLDGHEIISPSLYRIQFSMSFPGQLGDTLQVRIAWRDLAGNLVKSQISPVLAGAVARAFLAPLSAAELAKCSGRADLDLRLAAPFSCKKRDVLGALSDEVFVPIILSNRGEQRVTYFSNTVVEPGLAFMFRNSSQYEDRINANDKITLAGAQYTLVLLAIKGSGATKLFADYEVTGAHSVANRCLAEGSYPSIDLPSLELSSSSCEELVGAQ